MRLDLVSNLISDTELQEYIVENIRMETFWNQWL